MMNRDDIKSPFGERCTCERCKYVGNRYDKFGQQIYKMHDGKLLCSECRVNAKLDYNKETGCYE